LFEEIAPRFVDRDGGYTRILHLAKPRVGDAGARAILEFVGVRDRARKNATRPAFEPETSEAEPPAAEADQTPPAAESPPAETEKTPGA
jgi:large subunit ribosomal protein L17